MEEARDSNGTVIRVGDWVVHLDKEWGEGRVVRIRDRYGVTVRWDDGQKWTLTPEYLTIDPDRSESAGRFTAPSSKHRAGLDPEEIDWEAYKAFMRELQT
jgi:hypothetical protein